MIDKSMVKSNSNASRAARAAGQTELKKTEKKEKVVSGNVRAKKSNAFKSMVNTFINEDITRVKSHVFKEILEPSIKNALSAIVTDAIDMILFGETRGRRRGSSSSYDRGSYHNYYDRKRESDRRRDSERISIRFDTEDLVYDTKSDAEHVLNSMLDTLDRYHIVTVLDLYEFSDRKPPYTAKNYGWTNLDDVDIKTIRDDQGIGYILKLRRPMPID